MLTLALVTGLGGGLIRDGLFLAQDPTPLLTNAHYLEAVVLAAVCGVFFGARIHGFGRLIAVVDALGPDCAFEDVIALLDARPELVTGSRRHPGHEGYERIWTPWAA